MQYELDAVAYACSQTVVRLLSYHCKYNPTEFIWAGVKHEMDDKNTTVMLSDDEILMNAIRDNITKAVWQPCVKHT